MAIVDGNNGLSAADIAAVTGNQSGFGGFGGDGAWLILILLLFAAFNGNGWGGYGNGSGGFIPMQADFQRGFDQQALMSGIGAIQNGLSDAAVSQCNQTQAMMTGFASLGNQMCNDRFDTITTLNNGHNAILQNLSQYCYDNQSAIADLKYTVATENCSDRQALNDGVQSIIQSQNQNTQAILDKLCQQELDSLKAQNANLQTQINLANLQASQNGQTAQILADNAAQTATLRQALNPTPVPAYVVQNPNGCGCGCNNYNACGC